MSADEQASERRARVLRALRALAQEATQQAARYLRSSDTDELDPCDLRLFYEDAQDAIDCAEAPS